MQKEAHWSPRTCTCIGVLIFVALQQCLNEHCFLLSPLFRQAQMPSPARCSFSYISVLTAMIAITFTTKNRKRLHSTFFPVSFLREKVGASVGVAAHCLCRNISKSQTPGPKKENGAYRA